MFREGIQFLAHTACIPELKISPTAKKTTKISIVFLPPLVIFSKLSAKDTGTFLSLGQHQGAESSCRAGKLLVRPGRMEVNEINPAAGVPFVAILARLQFRFLETAGRREAERAHVQSGPRPQ